jgi:hypothetical protein
VDKEIQVGKLIAHLAEDEQDILKVKNLTYFNAASAFLNDAHLLVLDAAAETVATQKIPIEHLPAHFACKVTQGFSESLMIIAMIYFIISSKEHSPEKVHPFLVEFLKEKKIDLSEYGIL